MFRSVGEEDVPPVIKIVPLFVTSPFPTVIERDASMDKVFPLFTVKLWQTAASETDIFEFIITSSFAFGTPRGLQWFLVPQFVPVLVFVTEYALFEEKKIKKINRKNKIYLRGLKIQLYVVLPCIIIIWLT